MTTGTRKLHEFCWINMLTPQPAAARAFFSSLLGWTYSEIPGMGHMIEVGGRSIGGLFDVESPRTPKGTPPLIGVMVKVQSADAIATRVASLGGKAMPAFDIMDSGRLAVCLDPAGAEFDVWEPKKMQGTDVDSQLHGAPSWFENLSNDSDRAVKFYAALFGWSPQANPMPGFVYTTFEHGGNLVAGLMPILPQMGKLPSHWATYFTVTDVDQTAKKATELGAKLCVPVHDIAGVGRICGITSPQGVTFYAIRYAR